MRTPSRPFPGRLDLEPLEFDHILEAADDIGLILDDEYVLPLVAGVGHVASSWSAPRTGMVTVKVAPPAGLAVYRNPAAVRLGNVLHQ